MRRVLVPLDGSEFSETIIPDARELAGMDGELILVREASWPLLQSDIFVDTTMLAVEDAEWYLQHEAEKLRDEDVKVRTQSLILVDPASAIDEAARIFDADMVAIATHGRGPLGRLVRGGVAWRALAHSPVPVLLRHVEDGDTTMSADRADRRIMVPLDGSAYAEKALPIAEELALEWGGPVWLVQVVPAVPTPGTAYSGAALIPSLDQAVVNEAQAYLDRIAGALGGETCTRAGFGPIIDTLVRWVRELSVSHVVMASHGRTGLSRVILGSVADGLIHRLYGPVIVVPALAAGRLEQQSVTEQQDSAAVEAVSGQQSTS